MKKTATHISIIIVAIASQLGCYYDKAELVYPTCHLSTTDTSNIKYSVHIVNLVQANCYSCHGGTAVSGGGFKLDTHTGLSNMARNGKLLPAVNHTGPYPMPKGGSKLSECDIALIRTWVRNGYPNN